MKLCLLFWLYSGWLKHNSKVVQLSGYVFGLKGERLPQFHPVCRHLQVQCDQGLELVAGYHTWLQLNLLWWDTRKGGWGRCSVWRVTRCGVVW